MIVILLLNEKLNINRTAIFFKFFLDSITILILLMLLVLLSNKYYFDSDYPHSDFPLAGFPKACIRVSRQ
jgi:hypothetical protein